MTKEEKQKAIYALKKSAPIMALTREEFNDYIQTLNKLMDWLEQEPCDDCISRKRLKECFHKNVVGSKVFDELIDMQPSVNPQKIGHWIRVDDTKMKCSNCDIIHLIAQYPRVGINYCPNCGAEMIEPQETETWNGIHTQITAPKGTFERLFNEEDDDNDI